MKEQYKGKSRLGEDTKSEIKNLGKMEKDNTPGHILCVGNRNTVGNPCGKMQLSRSDLIIIRQPTMRHFQSAYT